MKYPVLRAVSWVIAILGLIAGAAYALGRLTGTGWHWWLAPVTFALDAVHLFRARARGRPPMLSPSGLRIFQDRGAPIQLVSSLIAAGVAVWGAFTEHPLAIVIGSVFALIARVVEHGDEPVFEPNNDAA